MVQGQQMAVLARERQREHYGDNFYPGNDIYGSHSDNNPRHFDLL